MDSTQITQAITDLKNLVANLETRLTKVEVPQTTKLDRNLDSTSEAVIATAVRDNFFSIFWDGIFDYATNFESLDGFNIVTSAGGSVDFFGGGISMANDVAPTANDFEFMDKIRPSDSRFDFTTESRFATTVSYTNDTNQVVTTIVGSTASDGYGFQVTNGALFGFCCNSGTSSTIKLIPAITTGIFYVLEARFYPGNRVDFYVNRTPHASLTTHLPQTNNSILWEAVMKTTDTVQKELLIYSVDIVQQKIV